MTRTRGAAVLGCALSCAVAAGAAAAPVPASIRVEGAERTIIAERAQATSETAVADRSSGEIRVVPGPTALGQLIRAGAATGTPVRTSFTDAFGPLAALVERIGPDDQGLAFDGPGFWLFKVNHRASQVAANQRRLRRGDRVLWYFTANFAALELEVTAPSRPVRRSRPFVARVFAYDDRGARRAAAGARVRYAGRSAIADAAGRVRLRAAAGTRALRATRPGDIRSAPVRVCGFRRAAAECVDPRPFGAGLRVRIGPRTYSGWRRAAAPLRALAAGEVAARPVAVAWRGRVYRGPERARGVARTLVERYLSSP